MREIQRLLRYKRNYKAFKENTFEPQRVKLSADEAHRAIAHAIQEKKPFFAGRFGGTEMNMIATVIEHDFFKWKRSRKDGVRRLCQLSGFFPCNIKLGERFVELMLESCKSVDLQAVWNLYLEDYVLDTYAQKADITILANLDPWVKYKFGELNGIPWTASLEGKKVLIIHPFAKTIQKQYTENREKIFQKLYNVEDILPEFELHTLQAVQTLAGTKDDRFKDWFEALEWMLSECKKMDFDVAIIGCGAYGYPLASEIKRMGKVAIHLGGSTQILFGILGKRWENNKNFMEKVWNENWVRPSQEETLENAMSVEGGCYW